MAKNFVIKGAMVSCESGLEECSLAPKSNIDVKAYGKYMATEIDVTAKCLLTAGFKVCRSQYLSDDYNDKKVHGVNGSPQVEVKSIQQVGNAYVRCQFSPAFPWQDVHQSVFISGHRALLEDAWVFCGVGYGIVSVVNSGQAEEDAVQQMRGKLSELERVTDEYMKANHLNERDRNQLLNSVLLWNGYQSIPWDYKSTEETRKFCEYLHKEDPSLFNYFERGLYLPEKGTTDNIDVTYLIGISYLRNQGYTPISFISPEMMNDPAMMNGFLATYNMKQPAGSTADTLSWFLDYYQSPDYEKERDNRYQAILDQVNPEMKARWSNHNNQGMNAASPGLRHEPTEYEALEYFIQGKAGEEAAKKFIDEIKKHTKGGAQ